MTEMVCLKKRIEVFLKENIAVHIILKNGTWLNGYITKIYDDYFNILDRVDGTLPVFYADIDKLEFFVGNVLTLKKLEGEDATTK